MELGASGVFVLAADLDHPEDAARAVAEHAASEPVHVLVNNRAGPVSGPLLEASPEQLLGALRGHLVAAHLLVRAVLPGMTAAGYGRIVQVLSTSVREPLPGLGVSNLVRAAVASWAKTLSRELPAGITINNVLPGATDTERLAELFAAQAAREGRPLREVRERWMSGIPQGRFARPDELAEAIAFLCSPAAGYIHGASVPVDGGRLNAL